MQTLTSDPVRTALLSTHRTILHALQPTLAIPDLPADAHPTQGRDNSLTFKRNGGWWQQCSVPRAASAAMLESLASTAPVSCFLHPFHPAALTEALARLSPAQAIIALIERPEDLALFLACEDFRCAFAAHRLFFATSIAELESFLTDNAGLPLPGMFIRTNTIDDATCTDLITQCQDLFARLTTARAARLENTRAPHARKDDTAVCVAPFRFTPWQDAAETLFSLARTTYRTIIPWHWEDPLQTSPLALLEKLGDAGVLLAADLFRVDLSGALPDDIQVITWSTDGRIAPCTSPKDRLLLTDAAHKKIARAAGWPDSALEVAHPPALPHLAATGPTRLIADTRPVLLPKQIEDFSSHRLLWERVEAEIVANPAVVGNDIAAYLSRIRNDMAIPEQGFPASLLAEQLVVPLWQQTIARRHLASGKPLHLHGQGWNQIEDLAAHAHGPLESRAHFDALLATAGHLLQPYPGFPIARFGAQPTLSPAHLQPAL